MKGGFALSLHHLLLSPGKLSESSRFKNLSKNLTDPKGKN